MPPLLLLCGLLCDETVWGDIPRRLADVADVRILSFQGFTSVFAMADHVLRTAPARFAVAGHSMGGRVALELVRRAPRRVAGIALLNSGVHPARAGEAQSRGQLVQLARAEGMRALAAAWLPPMMGAPPERVAVLMPRLIKMVERSTPDGFAGQIDALLHRPDATPVLPTIKVPTLLLSGTNDNWSTLAQHKEMQRGVAHATLVDIEDAGHMAPAEQPAAVANALRSWLALI
ncbi:MAG: alpha/beta fold hydrolase [Steroidobacteraceae bacterium]|jgi:pimeloyl-ACP methyl ester carboxylesterase